MEFFVLYLVNKVSIWHSQFFPSVLKCPKIPSANTGSVTANSFFFELALTDRNIQVRVFEGDSENESSIF